MGRIGPKLRPTWKAGIVGFAIGAGSAGRYIAQAIPYNPIITVTTFNGIHTITHLPDAGTEIVVTAIGAGLIHDRIISPPPARQIAQPPAEQADLGIGNPGAFAIRANGR